MDPRALMRSSVALGALACCVLVTSAALALPAASAAHPSVRQGFQQRVRRVESAHRDVRLGA
jgi:hypothetical protein